MKKNNFKTTGMYTLATFEYMGLLTYSLMKRSGNSVASGSKLMFVPVYQALKTSCLYVKEKATGSERKKVFLQQIKALENKINHLESKVLFLEKHGIKVKHDICNEKPKPKKEISSDKKSFLQAILNDNKFILGIQPSS
nr:magnetosome protein Mad11 [Desulfobacteraceae bacterium]